MYSVVLMMALSGSGDVAQAGLFHHRCSGGDCGGGSASCSGGYGGGYGCSGGYAASCSGGGHHHRLFGHHRRHGCHGGEGCTGGYGSGYGCTGGYGSGYGCTGGYGGGYGCTGGYGGAAMGGYGCTGGYGGGYGCTGGAMMSPGMAPMPGPGMAPQGGKKPEKAPAPKPKGEAQLSAPATIVVNLPAAAKLTVDGVATQSTSTTRVFTTPALDRGNEYFYTLKAEIAQDGQTVTATKRITVRAGEETRVSLTFPVEKVAQR